MKKIALTLVAASLSLLASCSNSATQSGGDITNPALKGKNFPTAYAHKKNIVISPYKPYNLINVKSIKPGQFARDMSTAVKGADGKPIKSSAKIFQVPVPAKKAVTKAAE